MGLILFRAWDDQNSVINKPDSLGIYPMENTVVSINTGFKLWKQMDLTVEYAASALTRDLRAESADGSGMIEAVRERQSFYRIL